jgi:hypothetical protein
LDAYSRTVNVDDHWTISRVERPDRREGRRNGCAEPPLVFCPFLRNRPFGRGCGVPISRVAVVSSALILAAAVTVLPAGVAGAQTPSTFVAIPSNDAAVSGTSQILDAGASSGVTQVQYEITGGTLTNSVIATATPTIYGWLAKWNTTTVTNGTYTLQSVATSNGVSGTSGPLSIAVDNAPPTTTVVIPADGSTLDSAKGYVIDAIASPGVTKVSIEVTIAGVVETVPTTPTIYGWIAVLSPSQPCPQCSPIPVLSTIQSVASYPGGVSGTSPTVNVTIIFYLEIVEP